jgi:hypothetical protein
LDSEELVVVALSALGIMAGVLVIWMAMQSRRQIREMEHRERLAMIEKGIVPAPELDPGAFDRIFGAAPTTQSPGVVRARSGGVLMIALGLAFMFMLSFAAGEPGVGVGIGGAFALVGGGFFVNSFLMSRADPYRPRMPSHTEKPVDRPQ